MHTELRPDKIVETAARLRVRIGERFPASGLGGIAGTLYEIAEESAERSKEIRRPRILLRALVVFLLACALAVVVLGLAQSRLDFGVENGRDLIQTSDAVLSSLVFLGAAVIFLVTLESRSKRREVLASIEELRVLAHVVDMHQLTKDPHRVLHRGPATPASPRMELDAFLLSRYLDYCSELLALIGKIPVLYAQGFQDGVVLTAVDDIESLTTGLSQKIWQKIAVLDRHVESRPPPA